MVVTVLTSPSCWTARGLWPASLQVKQNKTKQKHDTPVYEVMQIVMEQKAPSITPA